MQLEQKDKELAVIGSEIGCNCRSCVDHHIPKDREAGLSAAELAEAVATARAIRDRGIDLLVPRIDELLGVGLGPGEPAPVCGDLRAHALVAVGASVGVNSHPMLERHIAAALEFGLTPTEVQAATRMASYVQNPASEITADKAKHALDHFAAVATTEAGSRSQKPLLEER